MRPALPLQWEGYFVILRAHSSETSWLRDTETLLSKPWLIVSPLTEVKHTAFKYAFFFLLFFFLPPLTRSQKVLTEINPHNLFLTSPSLAAIDFYLSDRWQREWPGGTMELALTWTVWSSSLLLNKSLKAYYETNRMKTLK